MGTHTKHEGTGGRVPIPALLMILVGLFFLLSLVGFNPEDSLHFTTKPRIPAGHFLGRPGVAVSSFLLYYYGRASCLLVFFLFYASFVLLRRKYRHKRAWLILLAFTTVLTSAGFFSLLRPTPLFKGGGVLGNLIAGTLSPGTLGPGARGAVALGRNVPKPLALAVFGIPLFFVLSILLKFPITTASALLRGISSRIRRRGSRARCAGNAGAHARAPKGETGEPWEKGSKELRVRGGPLAEEPDGRPVPGEERGDFVNPGVEKARRFLFGGFGVQGPGELGRLEQDPKAAPVGVPPAGVPSVGRRFLFGAKKPPLIRRVSYVEGDPLDGEAGLPEHGLAQVQRAPFERPPLPVARPARTPSPPEGGKASGKEKVEQDGKGQYILPHIRERKAAESSSQGKPGNAFPDASLLKKSRSANKKERERETQRKAQELERTLMDFGIEAKVVGITRGPVITRYELQPAPGVKLSRIVNLSDNIALSLSANGVRIEAPIPGRSAVGIEIPNDEREIVTFGDIVNEARVEGELPLLFGRNISGNVVVSDLAAMPHLLIAGATGSGKSVCVNSLIMSLLFFKSVEEVRFIMIDPKMVELKMYNGIPHLLTEVVTDPRNASKALRWVIREMEKRYLALDEHFVRDIRGYNQKVKDKMPYIIVIVDEFANLMAVSQKDVEEAVVRLAAMSRAVGIHLIMATQRPSVDVITGLIKANFPYRVAFQVASKTDSRTILDSIGAEKLLGRGDMLFSPAGSMHIQRIQGAYITEDEVHRVVQDLKGSGEPEYIEDMFADKGSEEVEFDEDDPMFDEAVEIVVKTKRASASFIQRRLKIGYNRAARLIELMEEKGIIGPPRGSKPRDIYMNRVDSH